LGTTLPWFETSPGNLDRCYLATMLVSFLLISLVALIGRNDRLQTICAALLLPAYPVYFYVGQQQLR
jgi:hypothetical protein